VRVLLGHVRVGGVHGRHSAAADLPPAGRGGPHLPAKEVQASSFFAQGGMCTMDREARWGFGPASGIIKRQGRGQCPGFGLMRFRLVQTVCELQVTQQISCRARVHTPRTLTRPGSCRRLSPRQPCRQFHALTLTLNLYPKPANSTA
jgi:hypothetical protein